MSQIFNVYCDESCHLEHDHQPIMLLGAVWCPATETRHYSDSIRQIKTKYAARGEMKWNKVSRSKQAFYLELVTFFFASPNLNFRCLVVNDKSKLNHSYFNLGSHDSFYYKMYFFLLRNILSYRNQYNVYLDMKDTRSQKKISTLREVLCNNVHDFEKDMIHRIQHIRSREVELLQLTDFLLGAISYHFYILCLKRILKKLSLATEGFRFIIIERSCPMDKVKRKDFGMSFPERPPTVASV